MLIKLNTEIQRERKENEENKNKMIFVVVQMQDLQSKKESFEKEKTYLIQKLEILQTSLNRVNIDFDTLDFN